jgi:hypothetical protein
MTEEAKKEPENLLELIRYMEDEHLKLQAEVNVHVTNNPGALERANINIEHAKHMTMIVGRSLIHLMKLMNKDQMAGLPPSKEIN